jgi:hypothetical protein
MVAALMVHVAVRVDDPSQPIRADPERLKRWKDELGNMRCASGVQQKRLLGADEQGQAERTAADFALQKVDPFEDLLDGFQFALARSVARSVARSLARSRC